MQFKTLALATTSLVALGLAVTPASAAPAPMMGDVSLGYGYNWTDGGETGGDTFDYPAIFGSARVNLPTNDHVNVQVGFAGWTSMDDAVFGGKASDFLASLGLNYRDEQGLLGVFGGAGRVQGYFDSNAPVYAAGFDGQYYCGDWTISAQLGYLDSGTDSFTEILSNAGFAQLGVNYYTGKWKFSVRGTYVDGEVVTNTTFTPDVEEWAWAVGVYYMLGKTMPVSVFAEYKGRTVDIGDGGPGNELDEDSVNAGFTFHFGADNFKDQDRRGASTSLPDAALFRIDPP